VAYFGKTPAVAAGCLGKIAYAGVEASNVIIGVDG